MERQAEKFRAAESKVSMFEPAVIMSRGKNRHTEHRMDHVEIKDSEPDEDEAMIEQDPDFQIAAALGQEGAELF